VHRVTPPKIFVRYVYMYVCVYIYVYVLHAFTYTHVDIHTHEQKITYISQLSLLLFVVHACMHAYIHTCTHTFRPSLSFCGCAASLHTCMHTYIYTHIQIVAFFLWLRGISAFLTTIRMMRAYFVVLG
jgi:hypothetical protein